MPNKHIEQARSRVAPKMSGVPEQLMRYHVSCGNRGLYVHVCVESSSVPGRCSTLALGPRGHVPSHVLGIAASSPTRLGPRRRSFLTTSTDATEVQR